MTYQHTHPACYLVAWDDERIIKAGYSHCQRWRKFTLRGARLVRVEFFDRSTHAFALETALDAYLRSIGVTAFPSKEAAAEHLGSDGGGWAECIRVPNVADALTVCDRIADAFRQRICDRIATRICTYGRTDVRTYVDVETNDQSSTNASPASRGRTR